MELVYEDGALRAGATRGDGRVGEDVTANLRLSPSVPLALRGESRGRVFLYSNLTHAGIRVGNGNLGQGYAVKMGSEIPDWDDSTALPNGELEWLSEPPPGCACD